MNASLEKRLDKILTDERTHNGIYTNPNVTMTNLSRRTLTNDEHEVLKYGLKHGIATKPNENDISALAEDIYDIINRKRLCKENQTSVQRLKNSLRAFSFNILDIDGQNVYKDAKKLKILKNLQKDVVILEPDKGNCVVLINSVDYYQSLEHLFIDIKKFKQIDKDPTLTQLSTLQKYLRTFYNRGELTEEQF